MAIEQHHNDRLTQRLDNCNFVKTVLMMLIVLYHSMAFWSGDWFTPLAIAHPSHFLSIASQFFHSSYSFTFISGYIFFALKIERGKYADFRKFVINKLKRLVLPCIFVTAVWIAPIGSILFQFDTKTILLKYVLGTSPNQLWFLWMLFWVFIMFAPLANFMKNHDIAGGIIAVLLYFIGLIAAKYELPNIFGIWNGCRYFIIFWFGFEIRKYDDKLGGKLPLWIYIVLEFSLVAGSIFLPLSGIVYTVYTFVWHLVTSATLFEILQYISDRVKWKNNKLFSYFTKRTMIIYLFHQQIIYFSLIWFNNILPSYLNVLANIIISTLGSIFIGSILMKFKYTRLLIGEK